MELTGTLLFTVICAMLAAGTLGAMAIELHCGNRAVSIYLDAAFETPGTKPRRSSPCSLPYPKLNVVLCASESSRTLELAQL